MEKSVVDVHPYLYHYTTAAGLKGIVESQQLWATNIAYLNDVEEHTGFFDRRLPHLLDQPIRDAAEELARRSERTEIGVGQVVAEMKRDLCADMRGVTTKFNSPYVTSFCGTSPFPDVSDNGLLSQWRGYGWDGGYAIVFETARILNLLEEEINTFHYQFACWGDVEYYDRDDQKATHSETLGWESEVQKTIRNILLTNDWVPSAFEPLYNPVTALSCLHKHKGFREEGEVRIVVVPLNKEVLKESQKSGDNRPTKPVCFRIKNGVLTPYTALFGRQSGGKTKRLPISRVIVGPHPDRLKRQEAVKVILEQNGVEAGVTASDIPYLGR